MSRLDQQDFAAVVIDSLKFAAGHECITGRVAVARLTRLADMLADTGGWLDCALEGISFDGIHAGKLGLHLRVTGQLQLHCQRCLAEVGFDCVVDSRLMLVSAEANEAAAAEWPEDELEADEFDAIPASRELSLLTLVEEEVLLALPLVPRHADCVLPVSLAGDGESSEQESEPSPFAALAGLKKKH